MSPANAATDRPEPDFSALGPATRLAIRTSLKACDDAIAEHEAKLAIPQLADFERAYHKRELSEWQRSRRRVLDQDYPPPYAGRGKDSVTP